MLVSRELKKLKLEYPDLEVEEIDVVTNPLLSLKNGIRMIPTLKSGDTKLSGIFLGEDEIREFLDRL